MKKHLIVGLILLFATGCFPIESVETQLTLSGGERWNAQMKIVLPPESSLFTTMLDEALAQEMSQMQPAGVEISWRQTGPDQDGKINYVIDLSGQGFDRLNAVVLDQNAVTVDEETGNLYFSYYAGGADLFMGAVANKFTLRGGRIISSNGNQINNGTVEWVNPVGTMEAVLTESTGFSWLWILIIVLVIGGGFAAYWILFRRSTRNQMPAFVPPAGMSSIEGQVNYCSQCGTQMPLQSKFCPSCGTAMQT